MCCESFKKSLEPDFRKITKSGAFTNNYSGSNLMKKSNSRDREVNKTSTATKVRLNTHFGVISE